MPRWTFHSATRDLSGIGFEGHDIDHRWRVYLRPSSEESDLVADAASTLRAYAPSVSFVDVENPTRFHCHTKMATKYRSGQIFLAGDAAHLCSPAVGHGMNCGLQDAFNLGWKLALVHQGAAHEALLDSYEIERRPQIWGTHGLLVQQDSSAELCSQPPAREPGAFVLFAVSPTLTLPPAKS